MRKHILYVSTILVFFVSCSYTDMILFLQVENAQGISKEDPVYMKGLPIGSVEDLSLDSKYVYIEILVDKNIPLPIDSYFSIENTDMLGNKHIEIVPGNETIYFSENDTIRDVSLQMLINKTIESVESATDFFNDSNR
ncbi:MAG: MCE family protein [Bacteroidales bacterium]|jgi:phospholipid/cholesterol/gamma-HCH transport system substrate-binding protein|nr:MCE family protein [Bacteroidales bacterium]